VRRWVAVEPALEGGAVSAAMVVSTRVERGRERVKM
jgi:hypothetical protein